MKPIYRNSIAIGLIGIFVIIALYLLSAFLAQWEWQEHMRTSPGSGVLMVGVRSWMLLVLDIPVAFAVIGALSAWTSRRHITSTREAMLASTLAALIPIIPATIIVLIIAAKAILDTPEYWSTHLFTNMLSLVITYLVYAFIGLMLAIAGGLIYTKHSFRKMAGRGQK